MKSSASRLNKRKTYWYLAGFLSAFAVFFLLILTLASRVYSELPPRVVFDDKFKPVDLIVVVTGGKGRIRKALELYEQGYGKFLYISGIDRGVPLSSILKEMKFTGPLKEDGIIEERVATNTIENAIHAKRYLLENGYQSVLLVTSSYHVRRAHYIFQRILPRNIRLDVAWIDQEPFDESDWYKTWTGITVTVREYFKFLYAYARLTGVTPN